MKKAELRAMLEEMAAARIKAERRTREAEAEAKRLGAELEAIKANWRPVPMTHEWQPRNPQCALCDDPRDSARHQAAS